MRRCCILLFVLTLILLPASSPSADAVEVVFQPETSDVQDTWVDSGHPTLNHGDSPVLQFGGDCNTDGELRLFIRFDVSAIEPGGTVDSADLELYMYGQNGWFQYEYSLFQVTDPWDAGTMTWDNQPTCEGTATVILPGAEWHGLYPQWHVVTGLADLVQFWIDNPDDNHGVVIQPTDSYYGAAWIASSEYATVEQRPRLVVNGGLVPAATSTWGDVKQMFR